MGDLSRHEWEIQGETEEGSRSTHLIMRGTSAKGPNVVSEDIEAFPEKYTKIHLYHTYPAPGPVRRYAGWWNRDGKFCQSRGWWNRDGQF